MRVVYLNPVGVLGGGERSLLDLLAAVRATASDIETHLISCTEGPLVEAARAIGVETQILPMPESLVATGDSGIGALSAAKGALRTLGSAWKYATELGAAIRSLRPDVIHSNGIKTHLLSRMTGIADVPIVWHVRDFIGARPIVGRLLRAAVRDNVRIVANSKAVAEDVRSALGRRSKRTTIEVIYNGIDTKIFSPGIGDGARFDEIAGLPPASAGVVRIGLVATYARWKGQDLFLEAASRIRSSNPTANVRFYIIGGPIYQTSGSQFTESELRLLAKELRVDEVAAFIPFQESPADAYRAMDIVVHASTQPEPFGRTIVEAMACGRAVVVSRAGGAVEIFSDGEDAIGVPPANAGALSQAIERLIQSAAERKKFGKSARATAIANFDRHRLGHEFARFYRRIMNPVDGK